MLGDFPELQLTMDARGRSDDNIDYGFLVAHSTP